MKMQISIFLVALFFTSPSWADEPTEAPSDSPEEIFSLEGTQPTSGKKLNFRSPKYGAIRGSRRLLQQVAELQGRSGPSRIVPEERPFIPRFSAHEISPPSAGQIGYMDSSKICGNLFFKAIEPPPEPGWLYFPNEHLSPKEPSLKGDELITWLNSGTLHSLALKTQGVLQVGEYMSWGASKKPGKTFLNTNRKSFETFVRELHRMRVIDPGISKALKLANIELPFVEEREIGLPQEMSISVDVTYNSKEAFELLRKGLGPQSIPEEPFHLEAPGKLVWVHEGFRHELILRDSHSTDRMRGTYNAYVPPTNNYQLAMKVTHMDLFREFQQELAKVMATDPVIERAVRYAGVRYQAPNTEAGR